MRLLMVFDNENFKGNWYTYFRTDYRSIAATTVFLPVPPYFFLIFSAVSSRTELEYSRNGLFFPFELRAWFRY
jgi:hypothetical protein